jgi:type IV pilus assembly protein PilY1
MAFHKIRLMVLTAGVLMACAASAQVVYNDNFTGGHASLDWIHLNNACLTLGDGSGSIPTCTGRGAGWPIDRSDPASGALLLTPAVNSQTGAILSNFTFPMSQGLSVTFTTFAYGSTSYATPGAHMAGLGADGITFFLTDGTQDAPTKAGGSGGALGYSCSITNTSVGMSWNGVVGAYLGLGMDEYGNYLNSGDTTNTGVLNTASTLSPTANEYAGAGGNPWTHGYDGAVDNPNGVVIGDGGREFQANRIGLRGAGNVNFQWLHAQNPAVYATDNAGQIAQVCKTGKYTAADGTTQNIMDYPVIPGSFTALPTSQPLANVSATKLSKATPVTYKITISTNGLLNFYYSYNGGNFQTVLSNQNISELNGTPPSSFRFGFSAGTGGQNNVHEITCFTAAPLQSNSSAGANTVTGRAIPGETQIFLAGFSPDNWWGSLTANSVVVQSDGTLGIQSVANWDAKCVLTGTDDCTPMDPASGAKTPVTVQAPSDRNLYTATALGGGAGVALTGTLNAAETAALNQNTAGTTDNLGAQRVQWLQGVRSVEQLSAGCTTPPATGTCDLRARTWVLGDIIDSSPTFVGAPTVGLLPDGFADALYATSAAPENASGAVHYSAYAATNAARTNVVYVGSNDGFVHGFSAGSYNAGVFSSATNTGKELFAYMPYDVLMQKAVNLTDPLYKHDYLVDATPAVGDVFYASAGDSGAWHTWLVGGVGSSGREIYALDVTDPTSFTQASVIGDWDNTSAGLADLGNTVGTPIFARMHNGDWAFIFGSGLVSPGATAPTDEGVYVGLINHSSGAVTFQFLKTGTAPTGVNGLPGGIAYVSQVDLDGDHIADYLYAGDTQGRVWKFNVTSSDPTAWTVDATPLFQAKDGSGNVQPITTAITVLAVQAGTPAAGSSDRVMLYFGTGQLSPATSTSGTKYAAGTQTYYGIWDAAMSGWNTLSPAVYASAAAQPAFTRTNLLGQTATSTPSGTSGDTGAAGDDSHRYLDNTKSVCWAGDTTSTACATTTQYGWYFDFPDSQGTGSNEQTIYNAAFIGGAVVVNSATPPPNSTVQCTAGNQEGWTMAFNPATGGGFPEGYFADASGAFSGGSRTVGGIHLEGGNGGTAYGVGTTSTLMYGGKTYILTQTGGGGGVVVPVNPQDNSTPGRVSWRELVSP